MGPVMEGVGLNITVFSYHGSVDIGFMVDRELVPDVWNMADRVTEALVELQVAAGLPPTTVDQDDGDPTTVDAPTEERHTATSKTKAETKGNARKRKPAVTKKATTKTATARKAAPASAASA
jgi:hypothetical protein